MRAKQDIRRQRMEQAYLALGKSRSDRRAFDYVPQIKTHDIHLVDKTFKCFRLLMETRSHFSFPDI